MGSLTGKVALINGLRVANGVTCVGHGVVRRIEAPRFRFTVPDAVS